VTAATGSADHASRTRARFPARIRYDRVCEPYGVSQAVASRWFRQGGGMPPISLAPLSGRYLSFVEREEVAILHAQDHGVREIARRMGRAPSTVSRELRRNVSTRSHAVAYRATTAQWHAERRASRPKAPSSRRMTRCAGTRGTGLPARSSGRTASWCRDLMRVGSVVGTAAAARTGVGRDPGVPSKSRTGSGSISPMISRCGSLTKRSTRRSTCKAEAP
jgi:hypothetical protein